MFAMRDRNMSQNAGKRQLFGAGQGTGSVEATIQSANECREQSASSRRCKSRVLGWIHLAIALVLLLPAFSAFAQYEMAA